MNKVFENDLSTSAIAFLSLSLCHCDGGVGASTDVPGNTGESKAALFLGTPTSARPEVGLLHTLGSNPCTATLVDPRFILTASHCVGFTSSEDLLPIGVTFDVTTASGSTLSLPVDRAYALGTALGFNDIALARVPGVPSSTATPAVIGSEATEGEAVSAFGFGCGGTKQFVDYTFGGTTSLGCGTADSGGPRFHGPHTGRGAIWGVYSESFESGVDLVADAAQFAPPMLRAVRAVGSSLVMNVPVADFPRWAAATGVKAVSGDFNHDGLSDIALVGGPGWTTFPVAFGDGHGGFSVTNEPGGTNFQRWGAAATSAVAGDFDHDNDVDIALVGGPGWNTIPIAFSNRDGTFTVTNLPTPDIPRWAQTPGAYAVAGDFDKDGYADDIALVGGSGWTTIPVAFSNRDGTFSRTNAQVANFPGWSQEPGARALVGDFNNDGVDDIALSGVSGWDSIPVAASNRAGGFTVTNNVVPFFSSWAASPGVKLVAGNFDGVGGEDIAAVGGSGWTTIAFAFAAGAGNFSAANLPLRRFPAWATEARFVLAARTLDEWPALMLTGVDGWATIPVIYLYR